MMGNVEMRQQAEKRQNLQSYFNEENEKEQVAEEEADFLFGAQGCGKTEQSAETPKELQLQRVAHTIEHI